MSKKRAADYTDGPDRKQNGTKRICLKEDDLLACLLCSGRFTDPVVMPCGHVFCRACVVTDYHRKQGARKGMNCPAKMCSYIYRGTETGLVPCFLLGTLLGNSTQAAQSMAADKYTAAIDGYATFCLDQSDVNAIRARISWMQTLLARAERRVKFCEGVREKNAGLGGMTTTEAVHVSYMTFLREAAREFFKIGKTPGLPRPIYDVMFVDMPWDAIDNDGGVMDGILRAPLLGIAASQSVLLVAAPPLKIGAAKDYIEAAGFKFRGVLVQVVYLPRKQKTGKAARLAENEVVYFLAGYLGNVAFLHDANRGARVHTVMCTKFDKYASDVWVKLNAIFPQQAFRSRVKFFNDEDRVTWHNGGSLISDS